MIVILIIFLNLPPSEVGLSSTTTTQPAYKQLIYLLLLSSVRSQVGEQGAD